MNKEDTKDAAEVMRRYVEGASVEYRWKEDGKWMPHSDPAWDWHLYEYRIKPSPREFWVHPDYVGFPLGARTAMPIEDQSQFRDKGYIKVREVLES